MARKRKTEPTSNTGIRLGDLLAEHTGAEPEPTKPKPKSRSKLETRVDDLKVRASADKVPWSSSLEDKLRECKTAGAVRRLWREHRIKHGT